MTGIMLGLIGSLGGQSVTFDLQSDSYSDTAFDPITSECDWELNSDGSVNVTGSNLGVLGTYNWIDPAPPGTTYYIRVTPTAGSFSFGSSTGVWLATTTTRNWTVQQIGVGSKVVTFTAELATDSGGTNIVKTATGIQITANVF